MSKVSKIFASLALIGFLIIPSAFANAKTTSPSTIPTINPHPIIGVSAFISDLTVTSIQWTDTYPYSNCATNTISQSIPDPYVYFCVTILNTGPALTLPITHTLNIYNGSISTGNLVASVMPGAPINIPSNSSYIFQFSSINGIKSILGLGAHTLIARVDDPSNFPPNGVIIESNEANNTASVSVTIVP